MPVVIPFRCRVCSSAGTTVIDTYKHRWCSCDDCGNAFRVRKDRNEYLIPKLFPRWVVALFGKSVVNQLFPMDEVIHEEERFYDYYHATSAEAPEITKWKGEFEKLLNVLGEWGVDLRGKRVLDLSGGPGFVAKALAGIASKVVVTEFSPRAVEGMRRNLRVDARTFDYSADRLQDSVEGPFDVVLIRYSINFCNDLRAFAASLRHVLSPGGFVYFTFSPPTLGCMLRWQFDEYTYNVLYHPETMARIFSEAGFTPVKQADEPSYDYCDRRNRLFRLAMQILPYKRSALRRCKSIDRQLIQKGMHWLYRLPASRRP